MKVEIARILKDEGYIKDYRVVWHALRHARRRAAFGRSRERIITDLKRVSKPGRVYARAGPSAARPRRAGIAILSTSTGLITGRQAAERGLGGEVIARLEIADADRSQVHRGSRRRQRRDRPGRVSARAAR